MKTSYGVTMGLSKDHKPNFIKIMVLYHLHFRILFYVLKYFSLMWLFCFAFNKKTNISRNCHFLEQEFLISACFQNAARR